MVHVCAMIVLMEPLVNCVLNPTDLEPTVPKVYIQQLVYHLVGKFGKLTLTRFSKFGKSFANG